MRMFGGVAGAMDQTASDTLSQLPNGQYGFVPTNRYYDQVKSMASYNGPMQQSHVYQQQPVAMLPQPQEEIGETMNTDISKYIGKQQRQQQLPKPNSQLEQLKQALKPTNDQLEKVCVLLGMIYQLLENSGQNYNNVPQFEEQNLNVSSQEEIEALQQKLDSLPPAPTTSEIAEGNPEMVDEITV